jgi:hypothetical protein
MVGLVLLREAIGSMAVAEEEHPQLLETVNVTVNVFGGAS